MKSLEIESGNAKAIAVLGFAIPCSGYNQDIAYRVGMVIAKSGISMTVGNFSSTFKHALLGAKIANGHSITIVDDSLGPLPERLPGSTITVPNEAARHQLLTDCSAGAIVIGGGPRTLSLVEKFTLEDKPVCALAKTGGVVSSELDEGIPRLESAEEAVGFITSRI